MGHGIMVLTGLDVLLANPARFLGRRFALLTNHSCVTADFRRNVDALLEAGIDIVSIFAPEHGFWADAAYMEGIEEERYHGIVMHPLYSPHDEAALAPTPEQFGGADGLIIDVQDPGCRYYTYAVTAANCMGVAADLGLPVYVLDRPNPIGGEQVEGNLIHPPFDSFVAAYPVPNRHGMTVGELLTFVNESQHYGADLEVIRMHGWTRSMWWEDTALPWLYASPNMAKPSTALVYPGTCLFEGTNISEGRGTTQPFELFGAPWFDADVLAQRLNDVALPGVRFLAHSFKPAFSKFAGQRCHGVMMHVYDRRRFEAVRTGMWCVKIAHDLAPEHFRFHEAPYEFAKCRAIDTLTGSYRFAEIIDRGGDLDAWIATWPSFQGVHFAEYADVPRMSIVAHARVANDVLIEAPRAEA
ncbi:MAG TPA: DUF1343 domain-containing protein [Thermoanaerobaculia bacterium]